MSKKLVGLLLAISLVFATSVTAFAANSSSVALSRLPNDEGMSVVVKDLEFTGEQLSIPNFNPRTRAGYALVTGERGSINGILSPSNVWDYYLLLPENAHTISRIATSNTNLTMTLAVANVNTGMFDLTSVVYTPNQTFAANLDSILDMLTSSQCLAWVVQSSDTTYGSYQFQYNLSLPSDSELIMVSSDLLQAHAVANEKYVINGIVQNIDYSLDIEWEIPPVGGGQLLWQTLHIKVQDANVAFAYTGGVEWYESGTRVYYPNAILFLVKDGGYFSHEFSQNITNYYNWGFKDAYGIQTPRAFTAADVSGTYGSHYLIYDISTRTVVEFASGFSKSWSSLGDHHSLSTV